MSIKADIMRGVVEDWKREDARRVLTDHTAIKLDMCCEAIDKILAAGKLPSVAHLRLVQQAMLEAVERLDVTPQ